MNTKGCESPNVSIGRNYFVKCRVLWWSLIADRDRGVRHPIICLTWRFPTRSHKLKVLCDWCTDTRGRSERLTVPVLEQMGEVASHQKWLNHVVPAKALHDRLDRVGLEVLRGGAGQIKGQQGETWGRWNVLLSLYKLQKKLKQAKHVSYLFSEYVICRMILPCYLMTDSSFSVKVPLNFSSPLWTMVV